MNSYTIVESHRGAHAETTSPRVYAVHTDRCGLRFINVVVADVQCILTNVYNSVITTKLMNILYYKLILRRHVIATYFII